MPHVSPLPDAVPDLPVVSVVIPCYNAGDTLLETVESALASNYERLEVIVVDDGSTDDVTRVVLGSLPGSVRRVAQPNSGLSAARNTGVRIASGTFILPLDADDLIDPDYVPEAVDAMSADSTVGIVYSRATRFGATGRSCLESVVAFQRRLCRARMPWERISRSTRVLPTRWPRSRSSLWIRGEP